MVHWPDNPAVRIVTEEQMHESGICRVSSLSLGAHTGTHVDAPNHFGVSPEGVDSLPLAAFIGVARVVAIADPNAVTREEVEPLDLRPGDRVLLKTSNSSRCWDTDSFVPDYVYVTPDAARLFVERRIRLLGVDYLSAGGMKDGALTHRVLFAGNVAILEGLNLSRVQPGAFDLIALPLCISGADGAPARAVLRRR